jgi:low affinity Fe/Cu permease
VKNAEVLSNVQNIYIFFIITIVLLIIIFLIQHFYQQKKIEQIRNNCDSSPDKIDELIDVINRHIFIIKHITSSNYNISRSNLDCFLALRQAANITTKNNTQDLLNYYTIANCH